MKKILSLVLIGVLCLTLVGCTKDDSVSIGEKSKYTVSEDLASMRVKEGSLTKSKVTLILENNTDDDYSYGNPYSIEKEEDSIWYELKPIKELFFTLPAYGLKAKESIEIEINWESAYGKLTPGKYIIVKGVFRDIDVPIEEGDMVYISAEFTIK
jgi:hypothetical protein